MGGMGLVDDEGRVLLYKIVPKKVKGDRDRRPFWAGGENEVARRLLEVFWDFPSIFFHRMSLRTKLSHHLV